MWPLLSLLLLEHIGKAMLRRVVVPHCGAAGTAMLLWNSRLFYSSTEGGSAQQRVIDACLLHWNDVGGKTALQQLTKEDLISTVRYLARFNAVSAQSLVQQLNEQQLQLERQAAALVELTDALARCRDEIRGILASSSNR